MDGSDAKLLATDSDVLSGQHSSVGARLVTISLHLHAAGHTGQSFLARKIGDVLLGGPQERFRNGSTTIGQCVTVTYHESIVEGSVDVGNGEDLLTRGSLGTELDLLLNLLFNLLLTLHIRTNDVVRECPSISIQLLAQSYHDYDAVLAGRMDDSDRGERKRKKSTRSHFKSGHHCRHKLSAYLTFQLKARSPPVQENAGLAKKKNVGCGWRLKVYCWRCINSSDSYKKRGRRRPAREESLREEGVRRGMARFSPCGT